MFQVKVDKSQALVVIVLEGSIRLDEMQQFVEQAVAAVREASEQGPVARCLADLRQFRTTSPEAAELLSQGQAAAVKAGLKRVAEVVGSELSTLQLNRVARASGMDRILRRFHTEDEARRWLFEDGDRLDAA